MQKSSRRNWPRIPVPPELFDLLIVIAKSQGYQERTLYLFLYRALSQAYSEETEKLTDMLNTRWMEQSPED